MKIYTNDSLRLLGKDSYLDVIKMQPKADLLLNHCLTTFSNKLESKDFTISSYEVEESKYWLFKSTYTQYRLSMKLEIDFSDIPATVMCRNILKQEIEKPFKDYYNFVICHVEPVLFNKKLIVSLLLEPVRENK